LRMRTQEKQPETADGLPTPDRVEKLYMENTLLRVSGALFCHDAKRAGTRISKIELNRGGADRRIVIEPHPNYGQPGPLAHKLFVALIKKHSDYGRPIPDEVSFSKREIMGLAGRKEWGGRDSIELSRAIDQIRTTSITAFFKSDRGKFYESRFNIFSHILIERKNSHADPIEACTITLAKPIVASLRDEHFTCLNHFLMMRLGTIGQALYMRLFFHFANLYDEQRKKRLAFPKRYDDICAEWLGGLKVLAYKSDIIKDQLGPHLAQLINAGFLSSYAIEKAKTRPGFVITFRPGPAFFQDYDRFYRNRNQGELQWDFQADQRDVAEPLRVAHLFTAKRTKMDVKQITFSSSSDVEAARQLLTHISFGEAAAFIDYALTQAASTRFDVQTLGGLKQYIPGYLAGREAMARAKAQADASKRQKAQEALQSAYDRYRRDQAREVYTSLPDAETAIIDAEARLASTGFEGSLAERMISIRKAAITAQRHNDKIKTFEQWRSSLHRT
jgi:Replication initiator protein A